MAQHDYAIANQGFPAFRSDLNDALAAIVSNNSGATEPTTMFAHQLWVDTAANPSVLKIRNADNDAWVTIGTINQTGDTFTLTSAVSATTLNTSGAVVFNDAGADVDFRVEGDGDANLLFVDAGNDRVGVRVSSPQMPLSVRGTATTFSQGNGGSLTYNLQVASGTGATYSTGGILLGNGPESSDPYYWGAIRYGGVSEGLEIICSEGLDPSFVMKFKVTGNGSTPLTRAGIDSFGYFIPGADNTYLLGKSGTRWSAVWAANGTIQTSDERSKKEIQDSALGYDFIKSLRPVSYKWIVGGNTHETEYEGVKLVEVKPAVLDENGNEIKPAVMEERPQYKDVVTPKPGTRTHWGFIAQEVKSAVDAAGVDFGGWVLTDKDNPESEQALRYDQFIAPMVKALQEAMERIENLEAKVAALEGN